MYYFGSTPFFLYPPKSESRRFDERRWILFNLTEINYLGDGLAIEMFFKKKFRNFLQFLFQKKSQIFSQKLKSINFRNFFQKMFGSFIYFSYLCSVNKKIEI